MKELNLNELSEISGGFIIELGLGLLVGAACGVGTAAFADKLCELL